MFRDNVSSPLELSCSVLRLDTVAFSCVKDVFVVAGGATQNKTIFSDRSRSTKQQKVRENNPEKKKEKYYQKKKVPHTKV